MTLLFTCISPKIEDSENTLHSLYFAKSANNIRNHPTPNLSQIGNEFSDEEEEIRYINRQKSIPDLLHPNLMHQFVAQQQMLQHYMMQQVLLQAQNQQKSVQNPIPSPFVPISTGSPASTIDLKSPLNVQMYLNENNLPLNLQQVYSIIFSG